MYVVIFIDDKEVNRNFIVLDFLLMTSFSWTNKYMEVYFIIW